jgi:ketosteroid isomerase-like protein
MSPSSETARSPGRVTTRPEVMRAVVMRYFDCLNVEDWEGMADVWADECRLDAVGARPRVDREGVLDYFQKIFEPWPTHRDEPTRVIVSADSQAVVAEVTFAGTTGDGREITFDAVDVFDLDGGRIRSLSSWYDIDRVRRALSSD